MHVNSTDDIILFLPSQPQNFFSLPYSEVPKIHSFCGGKKINQKTLKRLEVEMSLIYQTQQQGHWRNVHAF